MNRRAALVLLTLILLFRNSFLQKKGEGRLRRLFTIYDLQDARRPRIGRTRSGREGRLDKSATFARRVRRQCGADESIYDFR